MSDSVREALHTLRDNIRDEKGSVQRMGVRDNNDTRDAIATLLENEAALSANGGVAVGIAAEMKQTPEVTGVVFHAHQVPAGTKLYTHPAPPSVAVPELNGEPPVTILGVLSSYARPSLKENGVSDQQVDAWFQGLKKLLTAAPSPDHIADAGNVAPVDDSGTAYRIGDLGNQIHNLGCSQQNNEELADSLAELAHQAWMLQRDVMRERKSAPSATPSVPEEEVVPCILCGGSGYHPEPVGYQQVCCRQPESNGECCGCPDAEPEWGPCQQCGGQGRVMRLRTAGDDREGV